MFEALRDRLDSIFSKLKNKGKLSEADVDSSLREVRKALLEADVDYKVVKTLTENIRARAVGIDVLSSITPGQHVVSIVYEEISTLMGHDPVPLKISPKPPTVILMVGLQGCGKTTTTVKLAKRLQSGHKPLVVACDLKRPAAIEQLKVLSQQAKIPFYGVQSGSTDVISVIKGALEYAESHLIDIIIIDTAGRLHVDDELMNELVSIHEFIPPTETLLVVDAMTGQEAVKVASAFHEKIALTGTILTKLDGDARGGCALAIRSVTGVPVKFAGVGEGIDAIELFDGKRMAQRIMGMGDVAGLFEKVQQAINENEAEKMVDVLTSGKSFNLEDLLTQFQQISKMGPLGKLLEMIPGFNKLNVNKDIDPKVIKHNCAIIQSMTLSERRNPAIIKGGRRRRIALGSGTTVQKVNQLLAQYEQMKKLYKQLGKAGGHGFSLKNLFGR
ncbi:MAG: signal recognition particle protein [Synergistaceae bacterium]|nr:signal recognition particle protein [Synergistaceae bacterium]